MGRNTLKSAFSKTTGSIPLISFPINRATGCPDKILPIFWNKLIERFPPSRHKIRKPSDFNCSTTSRIFHECSHRIAFSAPKDVFKTLGFSGVGVIPQRKIFRIPAPSAVLRMAPTLRALRILSKTATTVGNSDSSCFRWGIKFESYPSSIGIVPLPHRGQRIEIFSESGIVKRKVQSGLMQRRVWCFIALIHKVKTEFHSVFDHSYSDR